jgi:hypothetical protein
MTFTVPASAIVSVPVPSRPTSTSYESTRIEPAPETVAVPVLPAKVPINVPSVSTRPPAVMFIVPVPAPPTWMRYFGFHNEPTPLTFTVPTAPDWKPISPLPLNGPGGATPTVTTPPLVMFSVPLPPPLPANFPPTTKMPAPTSQREPAPVTVAELVLPVW